MCLMLKFAHEAMNLICCHSADFMAVHGFEF